MSTKPLFPVGVSEAMHKEISVAVQSAVGAALKSVGAELQPCCVDCIHINEAESFCTLFKATPPLRVLCKGCSNFERDPIPF